jgi:hypothetical protein
MGTAVVFGMLMATLVGVFFIPVFYVLLQRMSERKWPFRHPDAARRPRARKPAVAAGGDASPGNPSSPAHGD